MELRPRKGRSMQPPSTPTIAKSSPRPPSQSASRKKPAPLPSTPLDIPSDVEDADQKEFHKDLVHPAPKEVHADKVTAALVENGGEPTLQKFPDIPDGSEFETPLSSIAKLRSAQIKVTSSNAKAKNKVSSSVKKKKKMVKELASTPCKDMGMGEETSIATDRIPAASEIFELDQATPIKVFGVSNDDAALEETEKQAVLTASVPQKSDELAVEVTLLAQEVCSKKTEVLSPSNNGKKMHSSKYKSVKKRDEDNAVVDPKLDQGGDQEHIADVDALSVSESRALSLILSDDETVQVPGAIQVNGSEAALGKSLPGADISKVSSIGKKPQSNNNVMKEENLTRKLFEETSDVTIPCTDTKPDDQITHELGLIANANKEVVREIHTVEVEKLAQRVINSTERSASLKAREVVDGDVDASGRGNECSDIVNNYVQEISNESSDEAVSSRDERNKDINNDHAKLDAATTSPQKNAMHDKEYNSSNGGDDDASSGSDDDNEDEMASIFFSSMKAHLQRISEPSGLSMRKDEQVQQGALVRFDGQLTTSMVREPCANGRSTDHGLSWSPEIVLSASKTSKAQAGKSQTILKVNPDTIWGRDRCLQDGLCVPPVDPLKLNKLARKQKGDTAGAKWFHLSAPTITPEVKKELQLVKLRGALDPKRHYKAEDSKGLPKFFQVGTVVGGPADFYSGRLTKKEQKSSLASELLSDSSLTAYRKRKYMEIQDEKQAGGKGFWKKKKNKRTPAWAKI